MKKITNKIVLLILLGAFLLPALQSCSKYEEGPAFTIKSRTERLSKRWTVENYKKNDQDLTSIVADYAETFSKNGAYSYTMNIFNGSGTWVFQNNDMEIKITDNEDQETRTLFIKKLESKSFWYYYMDDDDIHELHMISE